MCSNAVYGRAGYFELIVSCVKLRDDDLIWRINRDLGVSLLRELPVVQTSDAAKWNEPPDFVTSTWNGKILNIERRKRSPLLL
ncbi:hypothetical protein [Corynebacterium sp. UMB2355A]|uniref:hypothetical protein n=1 Tax=Corynebacterium sp. UMB2355A TaxID=3081222 RepID=UPI0029FF2108|nr:hypothetical protein [Corynebacterium sp. UMB2355A]WPJ92977.1 hypothetical protein R0V12_00910 [Corynebacterium sp. UMB2355A]